MALAAVLVSTGMVAPAATPRKPIVESRTHILSDAVARAGRSEPVDTQLPTEAVAFDWEGAVEGAVEVRAHDDGAWSPWIRVEGNPAEGPDRTSREFRPRTSVGPAWVGHGVRKVEVRVVEGDLHGLRVHAIRSEEPPARGGTSPAGSLVPQPPIMTRAQWGADESWRNRNPGCGQPEYADSVQFAIVHHSVNANNYAASDGPALLRAMYHFHTQTNGWCDIGYNLLVDRYGQAYEGRFGGLTRPVVGAHAQGFNNRSTGVALIGNFQTDPVPAAAYSALRGLLAWKLAYHGIDPRATVSTPTRGVPAVAGHRDLNATACPGDHLYPLLPQLRSELAGDIQGSIDKPVLNRRSTFLLRRWPTTGIHDLAFGFGDPGDRSVMGDWDGNGTKTPALFRSGQWLLRNSNTGGIHDVAFGFGDPGDVPVAGDWNGDGRDTPGLFRNGQWLLRNSNTGGIHDVAFAFGDPGDVPVAGDWNGDRRAGTGLFRNGQWLLRNSNSTGIHEVAFGFGDPGDRPATGDWNGDGTDTAGVFRNGRWYLRNSTTTGVGDVAFDFGDRGDLPASWS